jgi:Na+/H+-translocating membrane pyrophosphatase
MANGKLPEKAAASLSTAELVKELAAHLGSLVRKQIELAKAELRADLRAEILTARTLGIAALAALIAVNLLLVTAALVLSLVMPAWLAGLIVTGFATAVAATTAGIGWSRRLRKPLARSRNALEEEVRWTKERLA